MSNIKIASSLIDRLNERIGRAISWLSLGLVLVVLVDVAMRYIFRYTQTWMIELEWHLYAALFLLSAGYTLLHDKHVRVDLFYARYSVKRKAWVDLIGHTLLLLPWCYVVITTGYRYMVNSWYIREGSDQPGGLPARYVIKSAIAIGFVLLLLQGVSQIIKGIERICSGSDATT